MKCITEFLQTFGESTKRRVSSKGIIISPSNKILLLRIQTGCHAEGIWDLPGGGIEDNESLIDCLKREVKEETNLELDTSTIKNITNRNFDIAEDGVHAKWNYFRARCTNTNVVLNPAKWLNGQPEHSEYMWLNNISDLEKLDICEQHKKILKQELKKLVNK